MSTFTDEIERLVLDWLNGAAVTQPTGPMVLRLMSANGSDSAAGTEVTGDLYSRVAINYPAATTTSGVSKLSRTALTVPGISSTASVTVVGVEFWDSAATPKRLAWKAFSPTVSVPAGESLTFKDGNLTVALD